MFATVDERVALGAAHLDKESPGWADQIDLGILNMRTNLECVLGQLVGGYTNAFRVGVTEVYANDGMAERHGFIATWEAGPDGLEWERLADAWTREVKTRRGDLDAYAGA